MKRKVLCIILMVSLLATSVSFPATASETNEKDEIIELLQMVEPYKEEVGFENVDFTLLEIGQAISVYDYVNGQFVFSRNAYPLFYNNGLVSIMYEVSDTTYQIMNQISEAVKGLEVEELTIAYDRQGCHVYDGNEFALILEAENEDLSKDIILNYVTQQPYEYICWAASIACITNYIRGTSYTAVEIAQDCLGSNFNQKLGFPAITDLLNEYLDDAAYYTGAENLFDSHIMGNLSQGYPLLGVFYSEWG